MDVLTGFMRYISIPLRVSVGFFQTPSNAYFREPIITALNCDLSSMSWHKLWTRSHHLSLRAAPIFWDQNTVC